MGDRRGGTGYGDRPRDRHVRGPRLREQHPSPALYQETGFIVRYADDYEIAVYKEDELEDIKSKIVSVFARYDFRINNEKTKYEKYPFYMFKNYEKVQRCRIF